MDQITTFLTHNWMLVTLLVVIILLIVAVEARGQVRGIQQVSPQFAVDMMNKENAVLVDVRESNDFLQGHVLNAINISEKQLLDQQKKLQKYRTSQIILYCANGQKSLTAAVALKKAGFQQVFNLKGGLAAWKEASLPTVKK